MSIAARLPAACLLLLAAVPAVAARADEPPKTPPQAAAAVAPPPPPPPWLDGAGAGGVQVGPDGVARSVFRPEFRDATGLRQQLVEYGIKELTADLVGPWIPEARGPPKPSRILLQGKDAVVRQARAVLGQLDTGPEGVFVSILVSEVLERDRTSTGGSMNLDKGAGVEHGNTFFRSYNSSFEPDDFLRSALTGTSPFEGTTLRFSDMDVTGGGAYEFTLRMLMRRHEAEYLAWPNLLCNEGHPGTMEAVRTVPQGLLAFGTANNQALTISKVEVGLKLKVTPLKVGAESALLQLDVWLRRPVEFNDGTAPVGSLALKVRQVKTQVTVRDREPLLLGGLYMSHKGRNRRGLPRPRELAVLDPLHSARIADQGNTEVMFLIRARVVKPTFRPPEVYPDGYEAWLKGRAPSGRVLRSPWVGVPRGARQLDETVEPPDAR